jgi:hypothetical protein
VAADASPELRVAQVKGLAIVGRVLDSRGRGVGGVSVVARQDEAGPLAPGRWSHATTDHAGGFVVDELLRGRFDLAFTSDAGFAWRGGVPAGQRNVVIVLQPAGRVLVRVTQADGTPPARAWVGAVSMNGESVSLGSRATDAGGVVELSVPVGQIVIEASLGKARAQATAQVSEGGVTLLDITLPP